MLITLQLLPLAEHDLSDHDGNTVLGNGVRAERGVDFAGQCGMPSESRTQRY